MTRPEIRIPKLSDVKLVELNIAAVYMSIESELQLFRCLKGSELEYRIERSVYNKRKRALFNYIEEIRFSLSISFEILRTFLLWTLHLLKYVELTEQDALESARPNIKENFKNCLLIGDRGYIGEEIQINLFNFSKPFKV